MNNIAFDWMNLGPPNLPDGGNRSYQIKGISVLLCNAGGHIYAVENRCSHNGSPLEGGRIRGHSLFCPVHGARFDLRDGSTSGALTKVSIRTFAVEIRGEDLYVALPVEPENLCG